MRNLAHDSGTNSFWFMVLKVTISKLSGHYCSSQEIGDFLANRFIEDIRCGFRRIKIDKWWTIDGPL